MIYSVYTHAPVRTHKCIYIYTYIYIGSISSLIPFSLNIIDIFYVSLVISARLWALNFYITFVIDPPQMMAQSWTESTRDSYNYGQYINQFPPNTIKAIREYGRIQKKICR